LGVWCGSKKCDQYFLTWPESDLSSLAGKITDWPDLTCWPEIHCFRSGVCWVFNWKTKETNSLYHSSTEKREYRTAASSQHVCL
jgi:hypothetical protein